MFAKAFMIACTVAVQSSPAPQAQPVLATAPAARPAPATPAAPAPLPLPVPAEPASVANPFEAPMIEVSVPMTPTRVAAASATRVVADVQKFYNQTKQYQAIFRQTYTNKAFGQKTVKDGKVYIKKPGKMRWEYKGKKGLRSLFVSDGTNAWMVEFDNKQYAHQALNNSVLPVAITFLYGKGNLTSDFVPGIDTSGKYGSKADHVLRLVPKKPSAQYKELYLVVDPANYRVKESIVVEGNGNVNHFKFYQPDTGKAIADAFFIVNVKSLKAKNYRKINPAKGQTTP